MIAADRKRWLAAAAGAMAAITLALSLVAGTAFRTINLDRDPLWLDEAYSAFAAAGGFRFLWQVVPRYETHPPFYYSLVRLWSLGFGDTLVALRALGLAAGLALMPAMWWAGRGLARLTGSDARRVPLAALGFAAVAPGVIEMAREVRPYGVMALVNALAFGALFRAVAPLDAVAPREGERRLARRPFALYCAGLAAMLWLHNLGLLYGAALGLGALILVARCGLPPREWGVFVAGHLVVAILYVPGLLILADQAPTWVRHTWLTFRFGRGFVWTAAYLWGAGGEWTLAVILLLATIAIVSLWRRPAGRRAAAALVIGAGLPVAASVAISMLVAPVFIIRTMIPVGVPAMLLLAIGWGSPRGWLRWPAPVLGLLVGAQMISSDIDLRRFERPRNDWYGALHWLRPRFRPGDIVLAYPNEGALPFDRAVHDLGLVMPSRPVPGPVPAFADAPGKWNPTGSRGVVSMSRSRLRAIARAPATRAAPTVWLLRLGPWAYDKGDVFLDELERDRIATGHFSAGAIDIYGLARTTQPSDAVAPRRSERGPPTPGPAARAAAAAAR